MAEIKTNNHGAGWSKSISASVGDSFNCEWCDTKAVAKEVGEHVICPNCNKSLWMRA